MTDDEAVVVDTFLQIVARIAQRLTGKYQQLRAHGVELVSVTGKDATHLDTWPRTLKTSLSGPPAEVAHFLTLFFALLLLTPPRESCILVVANRPLGYH